MVQISRRLNGDFWPTGLPLFHAASGDAIWDESMEFSYRLK
jgi:hypothetical protein